MEWYGTVSILVECTHVRMICIDGPTLFLALASLLLTLANSSACVVFCTGADTSLTPAPPNVDAATAGLVLDDRSLPVAEGLLALLRHIDWISWAFCCACHFVLFDLLRLSFL